ncbi:hypothetical protein [Rhodococcus pyridinivorans]|uniref:Uncharacterized protein n=1 Tax=Rhodococcus pyridinivorans AK37 TaxID=1114960 RepID=H0JXH3_9NOCA|nr:hypothetical protein [Rhodococcus pyridinivorans]EHK80868.1 hypothetical protein AK37_22251 [Rhodococcus pyridinivorans AK37]MCD2142334.1 hypothetical protein [Rhodococcus pyridinivorans]
MTAPNRREYPVSSVVIEELLSDALVKIDEINQRIGEGENVSAAAILSTYIAAFNKLEMGLRSAVCDSVSRECTAAGTEDDVDTALEFPR